MTKRLHNPKSHAPAVYIPCWLIQIPHSELSYGAKILYGRLAQWSNTKGTVYRSSIQLSKELGMGTRTIERFISELKDCKLIGTYHPQAGGLNHFEFYDHEWMHQELTNELNYDENTYPPPHLAEPTASPGGTLPPNLADINIKEIKEIKDKTTPDAKASVDNSCLLTLEDMKKDNPHNIDEQMLNEWLVTRKKKKAPLTPTAWSRTNKVMVKLVDYGLNPSDCFERMVASGWQGMEFRYFEQDINSKSGVKILSIDEKKQNEIKAREQEQIRMEQIRKDAVIYRDIQKQMVSMGEVPLGLKILKESIGIR